MKNIILKGMAAVLAVLASTWTASCSSDYLDLEPITDVSTDQITSNTDVAAASYYGLMMAMYGQYSSWAGSSPRFAMINGEPLFATYIGEGFGQDDFLYLWEICGCGQYVLNWTGMTIPNYIFTSVGWMYCYTLINMSNAILAGIDNASGDPAIRDYIKAGCLAIRAHGYFRLLQVYGPRWEDSNDGQTPVAVMRLTTSTADAPLSTMVAIRDQIYKDLDEAINLFDTTAAERSETEKWEVNGAVARGIYARTAMLCHDYEIAQKMAKEARADYPIMSADEYKAGFATENGEWMWTNIGVSQYVYYNTWGAFYACNGTHPCQEGIMGAGAINYDLYRQIPAGDIRAELFFTPDKPLLGNLSGDSFWNTNFIDITNMNLYLTRQIRQSINNFSKASKPNASFLDAYADAREGSDASGDFTMVVPFGAQYKFWCLDKMGTGQYPFMRGAEMLLTEAEAAYENGDYTTAVNCLKELNAKRNPSYTCDKTGEALREEIRVQRRIELWGEGHNWFDLKRWNVPMERRAWVANDPSSNNIPSNYATKKETYESNGWRFVVPRNETQYNSLVK